MKTEHEAYLGLGREPRADSVRPSRVEPLSMSGSDSGSPWLRLLAHRARVRQSQRRFKTPPLPPVTGDWEVEWGAS